MIDPIKPSEIQTLAPMPISIAKLATMISSDNVDMAQIARVIELDQTLTANTLRLANSAWRYRREPIMTVKEAVIRIGAAQILKLVVSERVGNAMREACPGYELAENELWRHSVASALASERLGTHVSVAIPGAAFTASLLHDIGKLLLGRRLGHHALEEIRRIEESEGIPYVEAERRFLGTDHAKVGGEIARYWSFPEPLVQAIEHHHNPDANPGPLLDAVHISNVVAKLIGTALGTEAMNLHVSSGAPKRLRLSSLHLESLCAEVQDALDEAEKIYECR